MIVNHLDLANERSRLVDRKKTTRKPMFGLPADFNPLQLAKPLETLLAALD